MLNRFAFLAVASSISASAMAADYSETWFPLWEGNEWIFHSGTQEVRVATDYQDGDDLFYLTGFMGKDMWVYQDALSPTYYSRIQFWNADAAAWKDLLRFEKANNVAWSVNLTGGACDTYSVQRTATNVTSTTPVGTFTGSRSYSLGLVPEMTARCMPSPMNSVIFAPTVGPVEFTSTAGAKYKRIGGYVDGTNYTIPAPKKTVTSSGIQATLSLSAGRYNNQPNTIACITQPCPSNQVNANASLTLTVKNTSTSSKTFQFADGQPYNFTISDATGTAIAKWTDDHTPIGVTSLTLAPGQSKTWTTSMAMLDVNDVQLAGFYTVRGWMVGSTATPSVPLFVANVAP